jgi:hypothetical protein
LARKRSTPNGRDRLDEAMTMLIQNQAAFLNRLAENDRHDAEIRREASERFARIEADIAAILRVLAEHGRLLQGLPEAVRDKIGFKGQQ